MATSERVLTPHPEVASLSRLGIGHPWLAQRPVWPHVVMDIMTTLLVLTIAPRFFGHDIGRILQHTPVIPVSVTLMLTTLFAFAGAYPRTNTPIDIGSSEGLVRGIVCASMVLGLYTFISKVPPPPQSVLVSSVLACALLVQREVTATLALGRSSRVPERREAGILAFTESRETAVGIDILRHSHAPRHEHIGYLYWTSGASHLAKRGVDLVVATSLLIACLPLMFAVALLIRCDSRGPVFIRQRRIGKGGRPFHMWKFRSMQQGVPLYQRSPTSDKDPRLTRVGRALRRFSIDELPQLFNVLAGEMSLVGPRPEMPYVVAQYTSFEQLRLNALPGLTGLWQISPARAMPIHHNVELDLFYIARRNVFLDLAILLRTVTAVCRGLGAT